MGCITFNGVGTLAFVDGSIDPNKYIHCESKKNCTLFVSNITLSNVDRF